MKQLTLLALAIILQVTPVLSIGYQPSYIGTRTSSMASLFSRKNFSVETVWLNPAAMAGSNSSYNLGAGINLSQSFARFQYALPSHYQANSDNDILLPVHVYFSAALSQRISIGFGMSTPYSRHIKWQQDNWAGRFVMQEIQSQVSVYQPSLAFSITHNLHIGAGLMIARADRYFRKAIPYRDANHEGTAEINGHALQLGINAGIYYHAWEKLEVGLNFKSRLKFQFNDAPATFHVPVSLHAFFPENTTARSNAATPAMLDFTGSYAFAERMVISAGITWVAKNKGDQYSFYFNEPNDYLTHIIMPEKERNGLIIRVGTNYDFSELLSARAGLSYQISNAAEDYFFPDPYNLNRLTFITGGSFLATSGLSLDLSVALSAGLERNATYIPENFGGKYKSLLFIPGIGMSYSF